MGYAMVMAPCAICSKTFSFNPHKVPSIRRIDGVRVPICLPCIEQNNPQRIKNGLEPITPDPAAYEPIHETEL
jgi:hypothetical protein